MAWKPDYLDDADAMAFCRMTDDEDLPYVQSLITVASRAIDDRTNRQFGKVDTAVTRYYPAHTAAQLLDGSGKWFLPIDDVQDLTGMTVTVDGTLLVAGTDYVLHDRNAAADGLPYTALLLDSAPSGETAALAKWGWTATPEKVPAAARLQINRWISRRESPYGVAGSPSDGSEIRLMARLDPDVLVMLRGLGRARWAR